MSIREYLLGCQILRLGQGLQALQEAWANVDRVSCTRRPHLAWQSASCRELATLLCFHVSPLRTVTRSVDSETMRVPIVLLPCCREYDCAISSRFLRHNSRMLLELCSQAHPT